MPTKPKVESHLTVLSEEEALRRIAALRATLTRPSAPANTLELEVTRLHELLRQTISRTVDQARVRGEEADEALAQVPKIRLAIAEALNWLEALDECRPEKGRIAPNEHRRKRRRP